MNKKYENKEPQCKPFGDLPGRHSDRILSYIGKQSAVYF